MNLEDPFKLLGPPFEFEADLFIFDLGKAISKLLLVVCNQKLNQK